MKRNALGFSVDRAVLGDSCARRPESLPVPADSVLQKPNALQPLDPVEAMLLNLLRNEGHQ